MVRLLAALALLPFGFGIATDPTSPTGGPADDTVAFSFADPQIIESSGLAIQDGLFATVNDSGDSGRVFTVDPADGRTVAVTTWDAQPEDVEAMAVMPNGDLMVADIGDNSSSRPSVELLRMAFGEDGAVSPASYELRYPDGSHDAETLLVHPQTGQVLVVAKEIIGRLYATRGPLDPDGPNRLEALGEVLPIATDGAFFPDGKHFVLRNYGAATFYAWPSLEEIGELTLPHQPQGEGLAVDPAGNVYLSSEGLHSKVLRVDLPADLRAELAGDDEPTTDAPDDEPGRGDDDPGTVTDAEPTDDVLRPFWPWAIGGVVGVVAIVVLLRSLRRPGS